MHFLFSKNILPFVTKFYCKFIILKSTSVPSSNISLQNLPLEFTVVEHELDKFVVKFTAQSINVSAGGILYSIISGDPHHHFYLNPASGELFTT